MVKSLLTPEDIKKIPLEVPTVPITNPYDIDDAYNPLVKYYTERMMEIIDDYRAYITANDAITGKFLPYVNDPKTFDIRTINAVYLCAYRFIDKMDLAIHIIEHQEFVHNHYLNIANDTAWIENDLKRIGGPFVLDTKQLVAQVLFIIYCQLATDNIVLENRLFYEKLCGKIRNYISVNYEDSLSIISNLVKCVHALEGMPKGDENLCLDIDENGEIVTPPYHQKYCTYIVQNDFKSADDIEADLVRASKKEAKTFINLLLAYERQGYLDFRGEDAGDIYEYLKERYNLSYSRGQFVRNFVRK